MHDLERGLVCGLAATVGGCDGGCGYGMLDAGLGTHGHVVGLDGRVLAGAEDGQAEELSGVCVWFEVAQGVRYDGAFEGDGAFALGLLASSSWSDRYLVEVRVRLWVGSLSEDVWLKECDYSCLLNGINAPLFIICTEFLFPSARDFSNLRALPG